MLAPRMVAFTAAGRFFDSRSVQAGSAAQPKVIRT
jgi:hypothetical protein